MSRFPHLCHCGRVVPAGQRCECVVVRDRARKARHDQRRPSARARGYNHEWRKARAEYLVAHPHCRKCGKPATVLDHIKPHRGDQRLFWLRANWQPLCKPCHDGDKQREERRS